MMRRKEAIIICPHCDEKRGEVFAVATEDRPGFWRNEPTPNPMPKTCSHCATILERAK